MAWGWSSPRGPPGLSEVGWAWGSWPAADCSPVPLRSLLEPFPVPDASVSPCASQGVVEHSATDCDATLSLDLGFTAELCDPV